MPNIVMTIYAGGHPVRVTVRELDNGQWRAKGVDDPHLEVYAPSFNEAVARFTERAAYAVDAA